MLRDSLIEASGRTGRRRKAFDYREARRRLATLIGDFSALRSLSAFQEFIEELRAALS